VTASPSATPPAPPGRNDYLMRQAPPVSAVVPVRLSVDGKATWTFVWFGYMMNARNQGIALCSVTDGDNYYGSGGCGAATVSAGKVAVSDGVTGSIRLGTVIGQAASVTAAPRKTTPASSSPTTAGTNSANSRSARSTPLRHSRAAAGS
jgi:hypothetical protein